MRRMRRAVSRGDGMRASRGLAASLGRLRGFMAARRVAAFLANDGEIDLQWARRYFGAKQYFLPVLPPSGRRRMGFAPVGPNTSFRANRYGILEPDVPAVSRITARELDLVLAPLVAFDRDGGRVGMGGGYYDATFEFLSSRTHWQRPAMVGVAYSFQKVSRIERDPWDIPLSAVVTEQGVIRFS